jgi:TPR repeat protein
MGKGFGSETQTTSIKRRQAYRQFLDQVLQITAQGGYNSELVYSLLAANLEKLNYSFAEVLGNWAASSLKTLSQSQAEKKAKALAIFSFLIREFNLGCKDSNLEIAIAGYQSALQIYTRIAYQEEWANIQYNLGNFYRRRRRGIRAENLEQAIKYFQNALQVFTCETFQEQ